MDIGLFELLAYRKPQVHLTLNLIAWKRSCKSELDTSSLRDIPILVTIRKIQIESKHQST